MSANNSEADSDIPRNPDTTLATLTASSTNLSSSFEVTNPNDKNLVVTDENGDQVKKDTALTQKEPSNAFVSLIGGLYLDYLDEMDRTFRSVSSHVEEIEIIIKKADTGL